MFNLLLDIPVSWGLFVFPVQLLQFRNHLVRVKCFELLGAISLGSEPRVRTLLTTFSDDPDPRVRMAVLGAMVSRKILHQMLIDYFILRILQLQWHERGITLSRDLYESSCNALDDEYEGVRLTATKIIWVLSQKHTER